MGVPATTLPGDRRCLEPQLTGSEPWGQAVGWALGCPPPISEPELNVLSLPCIQPNHAVNPQVGIWGHKTPPWPGTGVHKRRPPLGI